MPTTQMRVEALILLTRFNIPPDMQEVLLRGQPDLNVPPHALDAVIDSVIDQCARLADGKHWSEIKRAIRALKETP
jgi:hypothetical protein